MNAIAALLYAVATSVVFGLILGFQDGALDPWVAAVSLGSGAIIGMLAWWHGSADSRLPRPRGWAWLPIILFSLFSLRAFLWLIFREGDELRVLSPNNLGDMSLHLTFIHYFANGAPLWPDSPIFASGKLTYSAGMDFFNSLLTLIGVDTMRGLVWTGLLGALATGGALLRWGGAFAMAGFLCNGGLVGFACFFGGADEPFFQDYQSAWAWKSFPLALLVTQRGFLFALPAGLLLLSSWRSRFFQKGDGWRLPLPGEILLYSTMPFFHLHTFIALSFMLAAFFVARPGARTAIASLVAAALLPATMLFYLTTGTLKSNAAPMPDAASQSQGVSPRPPVQVLGWQPGWMVNDEPTAEAWDRFAADHPAVKSFAAHVRFLFFWLGNFGVMPLLLVPVTLTLLRPLRQRDLRPSAVWLACAAAVAITPLLGGWNAYQDEPLGVLLSGGASLLPVSGIVAVVAILAGIFLRQKIIRRVLFSIAGLCAIDWSLAALHAWNPQIPLLPANAAPLVFATFALGFILRLIARRDGEESWHAAIFFSALYLFFLCCNVRFAPWEWDNTKLMVWACLMILPSLWDLLVSRWTPWLRAAAVALLFFSGFISLLGGINGRHQGHAIAELSSLDAVTAAVRTIPVTATFASLPTYNQPLLLCGRKVVLGFEGHLGSHGIDYRSARADLDALMSGESDWRLRASCLGARYLFFGPLEREAWPASPQPWRKGALLVASGPWGEIFDLATPTAPVDASPPPDREAVSPRFR